ncbi:hypothetical protein L195_g053303 [Trifolium pratense]|uniref:Uncharacterized protein n=1 Tax=Trifolium pratense TaxID=57577 RepID=A0A2K3K9Q7_TRIPR|nr:hypothetical protein L195_g053303 [Trifolium pratense]
MTATTAKRIERVTASGAGTDKERQLMEEKEDILMELISTLRD